MTQPLTITLAACALTALALFVWTLSRALRLAGTERRVLRRHVLFGVVLLVLLGAQVVARVRGGMDGFDALRALFEPTGRNAVLLLVTLGIQVLMAWRVSLALRQQRATSGE